MNRLRLLLLASFCALTAVWSAQAAKPAVKKPASGREAIPVRSATPYLGAIVVDAPTGTLLFEDKADVPGYPASVVKLMVALLIEERIDAGRLMLTNRVAITAEAAGIGGSQVYLAEKEVFTVEDLLAATVLHSANDAAVALALHVAGSRPAFVGLMNQRAAELGLTATRFFSVHGLPPAAGQSPDVSTARDLATLAREVLKHPDVLRYSSVQNRPFRNGAFTLRNPDHLIGSYPGCDGLKTGYFKAGGFSVVSTAQRNGRRIIAVVLGCTDRESRDAAAKDLLSKGFLAQEKLVPLPVVAPVVTNAVPANAAPVPEPETEAPRSNGRILWAVGAGLIVLVIGVSVWRLTRPRS